MSLVDAICLLSTESFAKSLLLECLTEAGKSLMKNQEKQWSTVTLPWGMPEVAKCYFNLVKSVIFDTIMLNLMLQ